MVTIITKTSAVCFYFIWCGNYFCYDAGWILTFLAFSCSFINIKTKTQLWLSRPTKALNVKTFIQVYFKTFVGKPQTKLQTFLWFKGLCTTFAYFVQSEEKNCKQLNWGSEILTNRNVSFPRIFVTSLTLLQYIQKTQKICNIAQAVLTRVC